MSIEPNSRVPAAWLQHLGRGGDGIYGSCEGTSEQAVEIEFRRRVVAKPYTDYLSEIGQHHSIAVMDAEIKSFLRAISTGGWIVDIGGGLGWHWRHVSTQRPDIRIAIVDFVRDNLRHAAQLLGDMIDRNVFLIHGDATRLHLPDACFDGYWSVQTLQHVLDFEAAIREAHRILRPNGWFALYSLNDAPVVRVLRSVAGRPYHRAGHIPGAFYLERLSPRQLQTVAAVFGGQPEERFTEMLFNPDLGLRASSAPNSPLGRLDAWLSGRGRIRSLVARQQSLHIRKAPARTQDTPHRQGNSA